MSNECVDIGRIQAFLDGELAPRDTALIVGHTAECADCALLLSEAEEENAVAFAALDREIDSLVPTQRLWTRINDSIETERSRESFIARVQGFIAAITAQIANPSFAAAAGVLIVLGLAFAVVTLNEPSGTVNNEIVSANPTAPSGGTVTILPAGDAARSNETDAAPQTTLADNEPARPTAIRVSNHSPAKLRQIVNGADRRATQPKAEYLNYQYIPGEESYIKTIDELERSASGRNARLGAAGQVAYQRDLAVVNDSIKKLKDVVRRDPGNQAARQVLYSSYQDKIDLLNSAVQRDELMAGLR